MSDTISVVRTKAFKVVMSKGDPIKIDEEEVDAVVEGMNTGRVIIVKRGVINPSYLVTIIQDGERVSEWNKECSYGHGQGDAIQKRGIKPLQSIFGETKIGKAIEAKQQQRLSEGAKMLK